MSRMRDLVLEIQDMIEQNIFSYGEIARIMKVDLTWVYELAKTMQDSSNFDYDDSMDGDHDSAMASAGWGTDEDYGYAE